jgi:hypothetical protein
LRGALAARSGTVTSAPLSTTAIVIDRARRSTAAGTPHAAAAAYCHSSAPPGTPLAASAGSAWGARTAGGST